MRRALLPVVAALTVGLAAQERLTFEVASVRASQPGATSARQLGLRLDATTGPVDVLVIDRVERPSDN